LRPHLGAAAFGADFSVASPGSSDGEMMFSAALGAGFYTAAPGAVA
jgi:hypothetical protein